MVILSPFSSSLAADNFTPFPMSWPFRQVPFEDPRSRTKTRGGCLYSSSTTIEKNSSWHLEIAGSAKVTSFLDSSRPTRTVLFGRISKLPRNRC
jgi:hypothetical protein